MPVQDNVKNVKNLTCIWDNAETMRREYWRNGEIIGWYTKEFLDQAGNILTITDKMLKHVSQFQPGRLIGDRNAICNK